MSVACRSTSTLSNPSLNATLAPIGVTGCLVFRHVVNFSDKP